MTGDTYSALWVSYSTLCDFIVCPRSYFLKNRYKNPVTQQRIKMVSPPLSLGAAVHETLEPLSQLPSSSRFTTPLMLRFDEVWEKYSGKKGGFFNTQTEASYKGRGKDMIRRVQEHHEPLIQKAIKLPMTLPRMWLSEEDNIMLCGKIDWLEYLPHTDSVHIIDFKTGKNEEGSHSLQLPIYYLLASSIQRRRVSKMSYWYLDKSDTPTEQPLPNPEEAKSTVYKQAKALKLAVDLEVFKCPRGAKGCGSCQPYEAIVNGNAVKVGVDDRGSLLYALDPSLEVEAEETIIH